MSTKKINKPDVLVSEADAAVLLGVSIDTVRRERKAGKLTYVLVRDSIRIPTSSLDAYVAARTVSGAA
jgi:excisionase family DNA binding protein